MHAAQLTRPPNYSKGRISTPFGSKHVVLKELAFSCAAHNVSIHAPGLHRQDIYQTAHLLSSLVQLMPCVSIKLACIYSTVYL